MDDWGIDEPAVVLPMRLRPDHLPGRHSWPARSGSWRTGGVRADPGEVDRPLSLNVLLEAASGCWYGLMLPGVAERLEPGAPAEPVAVGGLRPGGCPGHWCIQRGNWGVDAGLPALLCAARGPTPDGRFIDGPPDPLVGETAVGLGWRSAVAARST